MPTTADDLLSGIAGRLREVQRELGRPESDGPPSAILLADALDSMGLVEFVAVLAERLGVAPAAIEKAVDHRFTSLRELADALTAAGMAWRSEGPPNEPSPRSRPAKSAGTETGCYLNGIALSLPATIETAEEIDQRLGTSSGWFERHSGIRRRHVWAGDSPLEAAAECGRTCLRESGLLVEDIGTVFVTSEAPPLPVGLAGELHRRLAMRPATPALEVGGACSGFLAATWLARSLTPRVGPVLLLAVEAPSIHLAVEPGKQGGTAALFGDGAAAWLVGVEAAGAEGLEIVDLWVECECSVGTVLRVEGSARAGLETVMDGRALASRAVEAMARAVADAVRKHDLRVSDLAGVVVHAGNGRMARLVARRLGLAEAKVWSRTAETGNLGSLSLAAAWHGHRADCHGLVVWVSVGAGGTLGCALTRKRS
jgi:3-oxoacyl-[acyl-carrier-protein] synthase-3